MNRTVGLRSLYRQAPGLVEPVLVIHGGQVIGRYVPVGAEGAGQGAADVVPGALARVEPVQPTAKLADRAGGFGEFRPAPKR